MFVKHTDVRLPAIVYSIRNSSRGQNVKGEILALCSANGGVAVDPARSYSPGKIGSKPAVRTHEIITKPEIETKIMIFRPAKNRLDHRRQINLLKTVKPAAL